MSNGRLTELNTVVKDLSFFNSEPATVCFYAHTHAIFYYLYTIIVFINILNVF